ncbi:MAG TPA: hypothetical protein VFP20_07970 [Bacteroidales bacterium]|nr:hypothetical protein [Bacteroidales bacterium]
MKIHRTLGIAVVLLLTTSMLTGCMMMTPVRAVTTRSYDNPRWAPPYYNGARYYYLPDLELYYDLATREYIYLLDGQWYFSPYIPAMYRNYDLDNCFSVVLNVNVYRPWLHHQYYLSHYPRYYYRDYYDHSNIPYVRAYNENIRRAIYWNQGERHRARPFDDQNLRDNRRFKYSKDDRKEQKYWTKPNQGNQGNQGTGSFGGSDRGEQPRYDSQDRTTTRPQTNIENRTNSEQRVESKPAPKKEETPAVKNNRTNYYGRTIGNSVKVTNEMKERTVTPSRSASTNNSRNSRGSSQNR